MSKNNNNDEDQVTKKMKLVFTDNEGKLVTDSLMLAQEFGKEHRNVVRDIEIQIEKLIEAGEEEFSTLNFGGSDYISDRGRRYTKINMTEDGFVLIAMSYTTVESMKAKIKFINEFKRMREEIADKREYIQAITDKVKANKVLTLDDLNAERFSTGRTIKTFANADMKTIDDLVHDFNEYMAGMDATTRMTRCKSAIDGIERLHDRLIEENHGNVGHCYNLKQLIIEVKDYRHKIENKKHGGEKAAKTKEIKKLKEKNGQLEPDISEYYVLPCHGFSENSQYEASNSGSYDRTKTEAYRCWIRNFPVSDMPSKDELGINWDGKSIKLFLAFDAIADMDCQNMHKSAIDQIFSYFGEDDNKVSKADIKRNEIVDSFKDGKIYWLLRNV